MIKPDYPKDLKLIPQIFIMVIWSFCYFFIFTFLNETDIISINKYVFTVCIIIITIVLYWLIRKTVYLSRLNKYYSTKPSKSPNREKKTLPLYFPIDKTITNGHSSWTVRVESRFGHRNEDIEYFIGNMGLSVPFCSKCGSNLDEESNYVVCKNKTCKNYGLGWYFNEEKQNRKDLLNTFIGEVRNNPEKWILIYREKFDKYTKKKNDEFEPPKVIRGIP